MYNLQIATFIYFSNNNSKLSSNFISKDFFLAQQQLIELKLNCTSMFQNYQQQKQHQDRSNLQVCLKNFYTIQNQPQFDHLIQLVTFGLVKHNQQLERDINQPVKISAQELISFRHRCERIILKNQKLKEKVIIARSKLQQLQNFSNTFKSSQDLKQRQITQKIKQLSTDIKGKILILKEKRYINKEISMKNDDQLSNSVSRRPKQKVFPLTINAEQLKKGTQFMSKQLKELKYDMEITQKHIKVNEPIGSKKSTH